MSNLPTTQTHRQNEKPKKKTKNKKTKNKKTQPNKHVPSIHEFSKQVERLQGAWEIRAGANHLKKVCWASTKKAPGQVLEDGGSCAESLAQVAS
jgi:hypothetical protein